MQVLSGDWGPGAGDTETGVGRVQGRVRAGVTRSRESVSGS